MDIDTPPLPAIYMKHHRHGHWVAEDKAQRLLTTIHFAYPIILLVFFLTTFTLRGILASRSDQSEDGASEPQLGPGGKPLPRKKAPAQRDQSSFLDFSRPRKLLFEWLALGAALTFVADAINVIVHALYARDDEWWCGQATVVSFSICVSCLFLS